MSKFNYPTFSPFYSNCPLLIWIKWSKKAPDFIIFRFSKIKYLAKNPEELQPMDDNYLKVCSFFHVYSSFIQIVSGLYLDRFKKTDMDGPLGSGRPLVATASRQALLMMNKNVQQTRSVVQVPPGTARSREFVV